MRAVPSVEREQRFVITDQGRWDWRFAETCRCHIRLVGLYFECIDCHTVVGHSRDIGMANFSNKRRTD